MFSGLLLCEFLKECFSANEYYSPHGAFKDLDLSRTFHYSECCIEKCLCCGQGLSPIGSILQDFRKKAQCSVSKWKIYTHCYSSAALPVILCGPLCFSTLWNPCISQRLTFLWSWYFPFTSTAYVLSLPPSFLLSLHVLLIKLTQAIKKTPVESPAP